MSVILAVSTGVAQAQAPPRNWQLGARVALTGSSQSSDPEGFTAFSTFPVETFVGYRVNDSFSLEFAARLESREIEQTAPTTMPLGSIEFVPLNLLLHYRLARGKWSPYATAGLNMTLAWEKSGLLDAMDVAPSFGPAVGAGVNRAVNDYLVWNVDFRWNLARTDLSSYGTREMRLIIDPASLGVGFAVRF